MSALTQPSCLLSAAEAMLNHSGPKCSDVTDELEHWIHFVYSQILLAALFVLVSLITADTS